MRAFLVVLFVVFIGACTTTNQKNNKTTNESTFQKNSSWTLAYSYYLQNDNKLKGHTEENLRLIFPSISGQIFGNPSQNIIYSTKPKSKETFTLKLPNEPVNLATEMNVKGLAIQPSNTKILRLGTFNYLSRYKEQVGGGAFINKVNSNYVVLVYFSKPSKVTGNLNIGDESYQHNIVINKSGWHWIEVKNIDNNQYKLVKYQGDIDNIEFAVYLLGIMKT
jgi:hypothetical protein